MLYSKERIVHDARTRMNYNSRTVSLFEAGDFDTLQLDEIIISHTIPSIISVTLNAPVHLLEPGKSLNGAFAWMNGESGAGYLALPDDFLRLISFKMTDWSYAVCEVVTQTSDIYVQQKSDTGIAGNPQRPVVAVVQTPAGLVLEFYSSDGGTVEYGQYAARPVFSEDCVDISERLYDDVVEEIIIRTLKTISLENK